MSPVCPPNQNGLRCGYCSDGYFGDPLGLHGPVHICQYCNCSDNGAINAICSNDGICTCKSNFLGDKCTDCASGFFGIPDCKGINYIKRNMV